LDKKWSINTKHKITIDLNNNNHQQISEINENQKKEKKNLYSRTRTWYSISLFSIKYNHFVKTDIEIIWNGNKCIEYLFSRSDKEFIIILDTEIHDISGFEVTQKICDNFQTKESY
jgi:hypothetical protein